MKHSLEHLPARKQRHLELIVKIIRAAVDVEMIILYGSHARGDWVEDAKGQKFSDYDVRSVSHKWRKRQGLGAGWKGENSIAILDNLSFMQVQFLSPWRKGDARSPPERLILKRVKRERKAVTPESYRGTPSSRVEYG